MVDLSLSDFENNSSVLHYCIPERSRLAFYRDISEGTLPGNGPCAYVPKDADLQKTRAREHAVEHHLHTQSKFFHVNKMEAVN